MDEAKAAFLHTGKEAAIGSAYPFPHWGTPMKIREASNKNNKIGKEKGRTLAAVLPLYMYSGFCLVLWDKIKLYKTINRSIISMTFFASAIGTLKVLVIALGAGLAVWGVINLLEGYGNDNPGAKSQGMKQLMAGGGIALIGMQLIPLLADLFK